MSFDLRILSSLLLSPFVLSFKEKVIFKCQPLVLWNPLIIWLAFYNTSIQFTLLTPCGGAVKQLPKMGPLKMFQYLYDNKCHKTVNKNTYMNLGAKTILKDTYLVLNVAFNFIWLNNSHCSCQTKTLKIKIYVIDILYFSFCTLFMLLQHCYLLKAFHKTWCICLLQFI